MTTFTVLADVVQGSGEFLSSLCLVFSFFPLVQSLWNIFGKVTYASHVLATKGPGMLQFLCAFVADVRPDWTMRIRLADPSLPTGFMLNIFARRKSDFPAPPLEGSILRILRLEVRALAYSLSSKTPARSSRSTTALLAAISACPRTARFWCLTGDPALR